MDLVIDHENYPISELFLNSNTRSSYSLKFGYSIQMGWILIVIEILYSIFWYSEENINHLKTIVVNVLSRD